MARKQGHTDKENAGYVLLTFVVIAIFYFLFQPEFSKLFATRIEFAIGTVLGVIANIAFMYLTIKNRNELSKNWLFYAAAISAVATCIWIGTWCAQLRWEVVS